MRNNPRLKKRFNRIIASFDEQRGRVREAIEKWGVRGKTTHYEKFNDMWTEAEKIRHELAESLHNEQAQANGSGAHAKVKRLKNLYNVLHQETKSPIRQWIEAIGVALVLAVVLRNFAFSIYHVPTGSAEPNILVGDRIWGNKAAYFFNDIKRGDLVIFDDPREGYDESSRIQYIWQRYVGFPIPLLGLKGGPINVVKRVIALPGDVIEGKIEEDKTVIYLNGKKLDEPYVNTLPLIVIQRDKGLLPFSSVGPLRVPEFLTREQKLVRYTYDPEKSYANQPYYSMNADDVYLHPATGKPILYDALTSTVDNRSGINFDEFGPRTIPENMYWMMGDSRKNSEDSRWWQCLDKKYVHGRASFIMYSVDSEEAFWLFDLIKHPIDFWSKHIRWNRFFKKLN
jgi:signal peptidase I